jgi:hypothetical protein
LFSCLQVGQPEGALDGQVQQLGLEGLGEEVVGAHADRAQRVGRSFWPVSTMTLVSPSTDSICSSSLKPSDVVGIGRQAQIHRDHRPAGGGAPAPARFRGRRRHGLEAVERPLDLLLQRQVVFDDQQGAGFSLMGLERLQIRVPLRLRTAAAARSRWCRVPTLSLSVIFPPNSCTYW